MIPPRTHGQMAGRRAHVDIVDILDKFKHQRERIGLIRFVRTCYLDDISLVL